MLRAVRRPQIFRFFGFFGVFGPFSGFFVVGEGAGGSGDPFSCSGIDFSCSGVEFSCSKSIFRAQETVLAPRRLCFFGFRFVFVIRDGLGGFGDLFSCSGIDLSYPGIEFSCPGLDVHAGGALDALVRYMLGPRFLRMLHIFSST